MTSNVKRTNPATIQNSYMGTIVKNSINTHPEKNTHNKNCAIGTIFDLKIYQEVKKVKHNLKQNSYMNLDNSLSAEILELRKEWELP